jgi:hypothetical protein
MFDCIVNFKEVLYDNNSKTGTQNETAEGHIYI